MLLPLGGMEAGYKGYGLAMIIGLLAGTLGGAAMGKDVIDFNHDDDSVTNTGQAICCHQRRGLRRCRRPSRPSVDTLARDIRGSQRMPGVERIVDARRAQRRNTRSARARDGIPIAPALHALARRSRAGTEDRAAGLAMSEDNLSAFEMAALAPQHAIGKPTNASLISTLSPIYSRQETIKIDGGLKTAA